MLVLERGSKIYCPDVRTVSKNGDPDIVEQFNLRQRLGLSAAQGLLLDTYLSAFIQKRDVQKRYSPEDFAFIKSIDPSIQDLIYSNRTFRTSAMEWRSALSLVERGDQQAKFMEQQPNMTYSTLIFALRGITPLDWENRALKPWTDISGRLTQAGIEALSTPIGLPGGIKDVANHFSTVYHTTPRKELASAIETKVDFLKDRVGPRAA